MAKSDANNKRGMLIFPHNEKAALREGNNQAVSLSSLQQQVWKSSCRAGCREGPLLRGTHEYCAHGWLCS